MADKPVEEPSSSADNPAETLPEPQHSTANYDNFSQPEKPIRNWTKIFTIFIIIVIVLGGGAGSYLYLKNHKTAKPAIVKTSPAVPAKPVSTTKSYSSPNLYLSFNYPSNWTIVDNGNAIMTVTSPAMQLKTVSGQEVNGKIVMTIQTSAKTLPGFAGGNATAVIASQKITYSKPTQTQRANTYVTPLAYSTTAGSNGLDAIYVSGNNGYTLGQAVPQADLIQVAPIISLTFLITEGKALTIAASNWDNASFSAPLLAMLESLAIT